MTESTILNTITSIEETHNVDSVVEELNEELGDAKKRKLTSPVWLEFERTVSKDGECFAICLHCKKKLSAGSSKGTSHLRMHLRRCIKKQCSMKGQQKIQFSMTSEGVMKPKVWKFDQEKCRNSFALAVIKHRYPFRMCEHGFFKDFINDCQPLFKMVTRNTLRSDIINIYNDEKSKMYSIFEQQNSRISLTTDLWTSEHQSIAYICLTSHFINNDWKLKKNIIAYRRLDFPHDGDTLFSCILEMALEWNIEKKLFCMAVDNASNNDVMIKSLKKWICDNSSLPLNGELFHVRCSAHILNLIVQDGLKHIGGLLDMIRDSVRYLNKSAFAKQKFEHVINQLKLDGKKKIPLDVPHRWNSTYLMLEAALSLKEAFGRLQLIDRNYKYNPSEEEWMIAHELSGILKSFYDATLHFSGTLYPTSNIFFADICRIQIQLDHLVNHKILELHLMAKPMKMKFQKYWDQCSLVLALGVILDPRYKMPLVEYYYKRIHGEFDCHRYISRIRNALFDLYQEYMNAEVPSYVDVCSQVETSSSSRIHNNFMDGCDLENFHAWYNQSHASNARSSKKSELDLYLEEDIIYANEQFSILDWWKVYSLKLPILGKMARDILAVPATTVASESAFSIGGRIIDEERSSLDPSIVEAMICTDDWVESPNKAPEMKEST